MYENILIEKKDSVQYITLNRPKQLNALNTTVFAELEDIISKAQNDVQVKGIIITGSGDKAFAAGADIKEFADFNLEEAKQLASNGQRIFSLIEEGKKPAIAAINGFALGGGLELAMACHLRIASENARFGQPEITLGVTPGYAGTQRLTQLVGKSKSMELLLTGGMINADEALSLGLVNYTVPQEELMATAEKLMSKIVRQSPMAAAAVIACVNAYYTDGENGFTTEVEQFGKCFVTEDFKEGTTAFMEKRKPIFPGK